MSVPPNGGWPQAPRPDSGQPGSGYSGPHPPQQPYPGAPGPWPPQPGYPPPVPPRKGNGVKWALGGVVLLLVIGLAVTTTLLLSGSDEGGNTPTTSPGSSSAPSDIASANDTGPVSVITVEPTCDAYYAINNLIADAQHKGWGDDRKSLGPASQWTPEQRASLDTASDVMRRAADQLVPLAKQTPHRVMRELYQQLTAYLRAYADAVPTYTPSDNYLADAQVNAGNALNSLCSAITYGSAPLVTGVDPVPGSSASPPSGDLANPERFVTAADTTCQDWVDRQTKFGADTADWERVDAATPGSQWTPEERAVNEAAFPIMSAYADAMEKIGGASDNPTLQDFAAASTVYLRALVAIGTNYVSNDAWISDASFRLASLITSACKAAGTR
jgi:hypothetical protein